VLLRPPAAATGVPPLAMNDVCRRHINHANYFAELRWCEIQIAIRHWDDTHKRSFISHFIILKRVRSCEPRTSCTTRTRYGCVRFFILSIFKMSVSGSCLCLKTVSNISVPDPACHVMPSHVPASIVRLNVYTVRYNSIILTHLELSVLGIIRTATRQLDSYNQKIKKNKNLGKNGKKMRKTLFRQNRFC